MTVRGHWIPALERIIIDASPWMTPDEVRAEYATARSEHFGNLKLPEAQTLQTAAFAAERPALRSLKARLSAWNRTHEKDGQKTRDKTFGQRLQRAWSALFGEDQPAGTLRSERETTAVLPADPSKIDEHKLTRAPGQSSRGAEHDAARTPDETDRSSETLRLIAEGTRLAREQQEEPERSAPFGDQADLLGAPVAPPTEVPNVGSTQAERDTIRQGALHGSRKKVKVPSERKPPYPAIALVHRTDQSPAAVSTMTGIPEDELEIRDLEQVDAQRAADACGLKPWDIWPQWNPSAKKTKSGSLGRDWLHEHDPSMR